MPGRPVGCGRESGGGGSWGMSPPPPACPPPWSEGLAVGTCLTHTNMRITTNMYTLITHILNNNKTCTQDNNAKGVRRWLKYKWMKGYMLLHNAQTSLLSANPTYCWYSIYVFFGEVFFFSFSSTLNMPYKDSTLTTYFYTYLRTRLLWCAVVLVTADVALAVVLLSLMLSTVSPTSWSAALICCLMLCRLCRVKRVAAGILSLVLPWSPKYVSRSVFIVLKLFFLQ